jgi:hemerythrin
VTRQLTRHCHLTDPSLPHHDRHDTADSEEVSMTLTLSKAPPHHSEATAPAQVSEHWPMSWSRRELLLERQHRILIDRIADLISDDPVEAAGPRALAGRHNANQRLLRQLRLHLRLEERWLAACGCLCPGHRAIHRQVAHDSQEGLIQAGSDRRQQLAWLRGLQTWLLEHTGGPDAQAYGLARSIAPSQR